MTPSASSGVTFCESLNLPSSVSNRTENPTIAFINAPIFSSGTLSMVQGFLGASLHFLYGGQIDEQLAELHRHPGGVPAPLPSTAM